MAELQFAARKMGKHQYRRLRQELMKGMQRASKTGEDRYRMVKTRFIGLSSEAIEPCRNRGLPIILFNS